MQGLAKEQLISIGSNRAYWQSLDDAEKRALFQLFVQRVWVEAGVVQSVELKL